MLRTAILCLLLVVSTGWVYADSLDFDFVTYDDPGYVVANPFVTQGISRGGLLYALTSGDMLNWQPLTWLSYMLDYELYGLNAGGYHATNLILHILNTLLLFFVLRGMTRAEYSSAIVAALFALHPLHVQSVVWISERKDVLSTFFALLSMGAYVTYARHPSRARFLPVAACLALGLMAKTMLVTLPLIFLFLDVWPLARWRAGLANARELIEEKVPLLLLALGAGLMTLRAQRAGGALNQLGGGQDGFGFGAANLANAAVAYVRYLMLTFWPRDLSIFYPHPARPEIGGMPLATWMVAGAAALLVLITLAVIRCRRSYAVVGWSWFVVSLLPVIGIVQSGSQALADRYTYVPLIGVFIIAVWGGAELVERWRPLGRNLAPAAGAGAVIVLLLCAAVSQRAIQPWRDSLSVYEHALAINPRNNLIRLNLGSVLAQRGDMTGAAAHFRKALEVNPDYVDAHNNLGLILLDMRRYDEAIAEFEAILRVQPNHAIAHNSLGNAWRAQGRDGPAVRHYRRAIELGLERPQTHFELANLLRRRGDLAGAMHHYQRVLAIEPGHAQAARAVEALRKQGITPDSPTRLLE